MWTLWCFHIYRYIDWLLVVCLKFRDKWFMQYSEWQQDQKYIRITIYRDQGGMWQPVYPLFTITEKNGELGGDDKISILQCYNALVLFQKLQKCLRRTRSVELVNKAPIMVHGQTFHIISYTLLRSPIRHLGTCREALRTVLIRILNIFSTQNHSTSHMKHID